ncbi:MAG TPA: hypothetical protein VNA16_03075 [Abditibacteriaceae bacterium]|nr:hypothetical protein [Abditibacteriaceae bacterium]
MEETTAGLSSGALVQFVPTEDRHDKVVQAEFDEYLIWRLHTDAILVARAIATAAAREWALAYSALAMRDDGASRSLEP